MPHNEVDTFVEMIDQLIKARIELANTTHDAHIANHDLVCNVKQNMKDFINTQLDKEGRV